MSQLSCWPSKKKSDGKDVEYNYTIKQTLLTTETTNTMLAKIKILKKYISSLLLK